MPEPQTNQQQEEQKFKIKVQGQEKEVPLTELLELAQKGDDYTQKTQNLAEEKKKMEEETQRKAKELAEEYLANVAEEQAQQQANQQSQTQQYQTPEEKRIAAIEQKVAKMEGSTEETKVAQLQLEYEKQLSGHKQKYPLMDERVVLATLSANPKLDMEDLAKQSQQTEMNKFKDLNNIPQDTKDAIVKAYIEGKTKQPKDAGGGPASAPSTPAKEFSGKDLMQGDVKRAATQFIRDSLEQ